MFNYLAAAERSLSSDDCCPADAGRSNILNSGSKFESASHSGPNLAFRLTFICMVSPLISAWAAARRRRGGAAIVASIYPPHTGITTVREPNNTVSSEEGIFQVVVDQ